MTASHGIPLRWFDTSAGDTVRDLLVYDTDLDDWARLLAWLPTTTYAVSFSLQGEEQPLPADPSEVVESARAGYQLRIRGGGLDLDCYFFREDRIELDLDARVVRTIEHVDAVLAFMRALGRALSKDVRLDDKQSVNEGFDCTYRVAIDTVEAHAR